MYTQIQSSGSCEAVCSSTFLGILADITDGYTVDVAHREDVQMGSIQASRGKHGVVRLGENLIMKTWASRA